jgi:uncharacterized protein YcaQ
MSPRESLSLDDARRIALAAQGFHHPRPSAPSSADAHATVLRLGLVQLDFVNVVVPAHYQVLFSRLGPYDRALLDDLAYRRRALTEQWAHEASLIPVETWPLLRHRMASFRVRPYNFEAILARLPGYAERVLDAVRARGPVTAAQIELPERGPRRIPDAWFGSVARATLEMHFSRGALAIANRLPNFARVYDLAERVLKRDVIRRDVDVDEADRALLTIAARAHGVGTARDLADYFRMTARAARPRLAELCASGELREVSVEDWREPAYLHRDARAPGRIDARALLSPFDPVVWFRPRARRLFGFDHRFEIFVPAHEVRWGRYVLPFLLGERLVARADLKADRPRCRLLVQAAFLEPGAEAGEVAAALARELHALAAWLGLAGVAVGRRGNLARPLSAAARRQAG